MPLWSLEADVEEPAFSVVRFAVHFPGDQGLAEEFTNCGRSPLAAALRVNAPLIEILRDPRIATAIDTCLLEDPTHDFGVIVLHHQPTPAVGRHGV